MSGPFNGINVLDFSQYLAGPFAAARLGDLGADVLKIERPGLGEGGRQAASGGVRIGNESPTFVALNRSKRAIAIDLKRPEGREIALRLMSTADVIIENFRPGVMARLGLAHEDVVRQNPRLIYVSATGYGAAGPLAALPGQDLLAQAMSGLAANTGRSTDPPIATGTPIADMTMAHNIAFGVATALYDRERSGLGQRIEVNLLDGLIDVQAHESATYLNSGVPPQRSAGGVAHPYLLPPYGIYATADGYLAIAHTPIKKLAQVLCISDMPEVTTVQATFAVREEISALVAEALMLRTAEEWIAELGRHDMWVAPVLGLADILEHPQVCANNMLVTVPHTSAGPVRLTGIPIKFGRTPGMITRAAPLLGEHTEEVLRALGYADERIFELIRAEVVGVPPSIPRLAAPPECILHFEQGGHVNAESIL